jgi:hypothetical protein
MITKGQFLSSLRHETEVIKHLAAKIPPDGYGYRPSPAQRTMLELLRYMTRMAIVPAIHAVRGGWEHAEELERSAAEVTPESFDSEMDEQFRMLEELIENEVDDREAETKPSTMPWGTPTTVGAGLMDMTLKCLVAYRMQLFLYVKAAGVADLGPANCWAGVDRPPATC